MQIVSQALFQRLKQEPLLHTATHNRIAYITTTTLTVREIILQGKSLHLKVKGSDIAALSLQSPNYIVLAYWSGEVQVRRIDKLEEIIVIAHVAILNGVPPKLRVSGQAVYLLGHNYISCIYFLAEKGTRNIFLQSSKQPPKDLLISSIFEEQIILVHYPSSIALTAEGKNIAEAPFDEVGCFKLLKDPLVLASESKQFLVVVQGRNMMKVFDIFDLEPIIQMELCLEEQEQVELKVDPLHEYLLVRYFLPSTKQTTRNHLLRINCDFYKGSAHQQFFLFDIQIGLKEDFILFPTHIETIQSTQFYSIDMCFFTQKEIRIATLVVDVNHRTKLNHLKYSNDSWLSHTTWKDFLFQGKEEEEEGQKELGCGREDEWEIFLERFYQENLQKLKCQGYYKFHSREEKKFLEYPNLKQPKDLLEYQDALNTLSGSSSFDSLKGIPTKLSLPFRTHEEGDPLSQHQDWESKPHQSVEHSDSEQSQRDEYLNLIQDQVLQVLVPIDSKIQLLHQKLDRFQNVHTRKLYTIHKSIKSHQKETSKIDKNIQNWCKQQMDLFALQIKQSMKDYSSMLGRLQIVQLRSVKKLKKHYRDCLDMELERCGEKLEDGERSLGEVQRIASKHSKF